jgi:3-deoxy-D-manno-octulosonic-acid transferase
MIIDKTWFLFYNYIVIPFVYMAALPVSLFNKKLKLGMKGRKRLFEELIVSAANLDKKKKLVWFHSSSLGEFEQAKPIIEKLKQQVKVNILVTFFSPSGYLNSKKYPHADLVAYMPFDLKSLSEKFMKIVNPDLAVFMRYDIWPNHIWALGKKRIPSLLVDATMRKESPRLKSFFSRSFHKSIFTKITEILTVSEADSENFLKFGCDKKRVFAIGDTRFDRVYQRSISAQEKNLIKEDILKGKKVIVAGSTWDEDEEVLVPVFITLAKHDKDMLFIIAPHEPTLPHLEKLENDFTGKLSTVRFSLLNNYKGERVILIDSIGILLTLYYYAGAAFIGGSFKSNVHNVLEAAVYGVPVLFGPKINNSQEVFRLLELGGGILIKNKRDAYRQFRALFTNEKLRLEKGKISKDYVQKNTGATDKILAEIYKML